MPGIFNLSELSFILNLILIIIAIRKNNILLASCFFFQLFLVAGQAVQIQDDLIEVDRVLYLNHEISGAGFFWAQIYFFCALIGQLLLLVGSKRISLKSRAQLSENIRISSFSYLLILLFILFSAVVLIFFVVGTESVVNDSRPGIASGTTIFLVFISLGLMPSLEKISRNQELKAFDIFLAMISIIISMLFSRLHIVIYILSYLVALFYSRDRRISLVDLLRPKILFFPLLGCIVFFGVGAYRDALNHETGSFSDIIQYIYNNPDTGVLTIRYNYMIGIEGMSGIAGAFTEALQKPSRLLPSDFGFITILMSSLQVIPGFVKSFMATTIDTVRDLYWYRSSIVPPGIEISFVSFGILGAFIYPAIFILSCNKITKSFLSAKGSFGRIFFIFLAGLQVLMVRGSWHVWLAHIIAYYVGIKIYLLITNIKVIQQQTQT